MGVIVLCAMAAGLKSPAYNKVKPGDDDQDGAQDRAVVVIATFIISTLNLQSATSKRFGRLV